MIINTTATRHALKRVADGFPSFVDRALMDIVSVAQGVAKSSTKFKDHSPSGLRANINIVRNGSLSYILSADKPYAGYVEYGNRPGGTGEYIYPVRAKALRFVIDGKVIFAKRVKSHGALSFMRDGVETATDHAMVFISSDFDRLLGGS